MAKPHKSTFEALVDAFCEFPNGQPDVERSSAGQLISDKVASGGAPVVRVLDAMQEDT